MDIIGRIIIDEGGLVNNPADPGGITNYGITLPFLREFGSSTATAEDIIALTPEHARYIYTKAMGAWGIDKIQNEDVRYVVFDAAVNMGPTQGVKLLQRALGLKADGIIGAVTLAAIPYRDGLKLVRLILVEKMLFYSRLAAGDLTDADKDGIPDRLEVLVGWHNRVAKQMKEFA